MSPFHNATAEKRDRIPRTDKVVLAEARRYLYRLYTDRAARRLIVIGLGLSSCDQVRPLDDRRYAVQDKRLGESYAVDLGDMTSDCPCDARPCSHYFAVVFNAQVRAVAQRRRGSPACQRGDGAPAIGRTRLCTTHLSELRERLAA